MPLILLFVFTNYSIIFLIATNWRHIYFITLRLLIVWREHVWVHCLREMEILKSVDGSNGSWKPLGLLVDDLKVSNPSAPEVPSFGVCLICVLHGAYNTGQKCSD